MKGLMIYDEIGYKRNEWFANKIITQGKKYDLDIDLAIYTNNYDIDNNYDFSIVRTIDPKLSEDLEDHGIRCFNNALTSKIANDKWLTYLLGKKLNIPVMNTSLEPFQEYPMIVKSRDGHGGSEVFWADDPTKLQVIKESLANKSLIYQKVASTIGKDMRIYLLDSKIIACILRYNPRDFRSNFSLGGSICKVQCDDKQKTIVEKILSYLKCDFVGIDFIYDKGHWVLNEIEDVVGTRMLYQLNELDPIDLYLQVIAQKLMR